MQVCVTRRQRQVLQDNKTCSYELNDKNPRNGLIHGLQSGSDANEQQITQLCHLHAEQAANLM